MAQTNSIFTDKRINWLDNLKAIGIFYVVLGHILMLVEAPIFYNKYIFSFHLPVFIFVSGYLFDLEKYPNFIGFFKKRFKSLIVPYFIFTFLALIVLFIFQYSNVYDFGYEINGIGSFLVPVTKIFYTHHISVINGPIWFLTFLFIIEIYYYLLRRNIKNNKVLLFILIESSVIGYLYSLFIEFGLPWHIEVALIGIVFYGIANIYKNQINHLSDKLLKKHFLAIFSLFMFLIINILFAFLNDSAGLYNNKYGNYFFFFIASFSGILFYLLISKIIRDSKILSFIGKNTIIILCMHAFFSFLILLTIHNYIVINLLSFNTPLIFPAIAYTYLLMIIMIPFIVVINRYFPFLVGRSKKNNLHKY